MNLKKTVCYEDFGAIGDGKTDDFDAIARAHEYANENGLDVVCNNGKTYYIGDTGLDEKESKPTVKIKTNVDWGNSTIIIDDSNITVDMPARQTRLFTVCREHATVTYTAENDTPNGAIKRINEMGGFTTDIKKLDIGIGYAAMLTVKNENHRVYIRYGANKDSGDVQSEIISVDAEGNIDPNTAFLIDYKEVTSITVTRADDTPLTIKGGTVINIANRVKEDYRYYNRNMLIARSNVTISNVTYDIVGEGEHGDPYAGFFHIYSANNVLMENCNLKGHKYYWCVGRGGGDPVGMGTYTLNIHGSNNVAFKNCKQTNFFCDDGVTVRDDIWGIMGSSYCKNLSYEDCILSRFDAHAGVYNSKIINSHVQDFALIGGGTMTIENSHLYNNLLVIFRPDYGSTWRGDVIVKNVTIHNTSDSVNLFNARWVNHDFGYPTYLPENIVIDGLKITNGNTVTVFTERFIEQSEMAGSDEVDGKTNVNKMTPPKTITIKNNESNINFIKPQSKFFENTKIIEE
ncbi:MAG: hypothetical protein J6Q68_05120 [Clostridia bacterium]|nr:hypothetical protein [Clostridia bacterium]